MTRVNLENNNIYSPNFKTGFRKTTSIQAITGNVILVAGMPVVLGFDPGNVTRSVQMEPLPVPANDGIEHDIVHYGTGTGNLTVLNQLGASLGTIYPGGYAKLRVINGAWVMYPFSNSTQPSANAQDTYTYYTTLASLANGQILALPVPFNFKLNTVGFRVRSPAVTAAKLATLTAQVNGVSVTGGVVALTSANATPSGTLVAGSAITAGNTGTAGQTVGVIVSGVTAFVEGDGNVEWNVTATG